MIATIVQPKDKDLHRESAVQHSPVESAAATVTMCMLVKT